MKSMMRFTIIGFMLIFAVSCSKERLEEDDFSSMDEFYNQHRQQEDEYVIDSGGTCPLITRFQTKICMGKGALTLADGSTFNYPWKLKVVELYSVKDMMLWPMQSMSGDSLLKLSPMFRIRAFKDDSELKMRTGASYYVETDTINPIVSGMNVHYGSQEPVLVNWTTAPATGDTITNLNTTAETYQMKLRAPGWFMAATKYGGAPLTSVKLTAVGKNTQNIEIFIVFKNHKALTKVKNLQSAPVPVGEQATLFAMAKKSTGAFVLHKENITISANMEIALKLEEVSEAQLLSAMDGL